MSRQLVFVFLFGCFGTFVLVSGVLMRAGIWKAWFATERIPVLVPTSLGFGLIPAGLMFLSFILAYKFQSEAGLTIFDCLVPFFLISSIVLAIWQPWWVKPAWYRWLEEHHGDIITILKEEARAMGRWKWQRRVATQAGLEAWVAEVRQKHDLD